MTLDESAHEKHDGDARRVAAVDAPAEDRFGDAVLAHNEELARFAFLLTGDVDTAEATVTETYARLWPRFRRRRIDDVLPHLMRAIVIDVRERNRRTAGEPDTAPRAQHAQTPWAALQQLPFEQRTAVIVHVVEGIDLDETATMLGESRDLTATRVDAGLGRIAELLVHGDPHG